MLFCVMFPSPTSSARNWPTSLSYQSSPDRRHASRAPTRRSMCPSWIGHRYVTITLCSTQVPLYSNTEAWCLAVCMPPALMAVACPAARACSIASLRMPSAGSKICRRHRLVSPRHRIPQRPRPCPGVHCVLDGCFGRICNRCSSTGQGGVAVGGISLRQLWNARRSLATRRGTCQEIQSQRGR